MPVRHWLLLVLRYNIKNSMSLERRTICPSLFLVILNCVRQSLYVQMYVQIAAIVEEIYKMWYDVFSRILLENIVKEK